MGDFIKICVQSFGSWQRIFYDYIEAGIVCEQSDIWSYINYDVIYIYKRKSKGPKIDPCGTPAFMETQSEVTPGRTTRCFLSKR